MVYEIQVVPYEPNWPAQFAIESARISKALGDNCINVHHVGSTSVPDLVAKPKIDVIAVVKDLFFDKSWLEAIGYKYRGGFNIPLRRSFTIREPNRNINLHIFEEHDPEIELNILFRDYLRTHPIARDEYADLKHELLETESSFEKNNSMYTGYTLGKHDFIQKILKQSDYNKHRFVLCTHYSEWDAVRYFRNKYLFGPHGIDDPYTWTFNHKDHAHLVFYQGTEIIGYSHVQVWPAARAAIRIIVIDEPYRMHGFGAKFLFLIEKWLKGQGCSCIHTESTSGSFLFYEKQGYTEIPFDDPDGYKGSPDNIAVGKIL